MHISLRRRSLLIGLSASAALLAQPAWGQQSVAPEAPESGAVLDEIIVTGQPLNKALDVNVGAFGGQNPLDLQLSIETLEPAASDTRALRTMLNLLQNHDTG